VESPVRAKINSAGHQGPAREQWTEDRVDPTQVVAFKAARPQALTIGFGRRFATKRLAALRDIDRLKDSLT
jgi:hypothetical protein